MNDFKEKRALSNRLSRVNLRVFYRALFLILVVFISTQTLYAKDLDWVFIEKKDGIELFKSKEKIDGLIPFKVKTILNFSHEKVVKVLINSEKKSLWAPKLKKTKLHQKLAFNKFIYSEYYSVPFPFYDREFFLQGTIQSDNGSIIFCAQNPEIGHEPAEDHVVVNIRKLEFIITPVENDRTHIEFTFIGDMGGLVPKFVVNIIQRRWPVKFLVAMSEYIQQNNDIECQRYNTFMEEASDNKTPGQS